MNKTKGYFTVEMTLIFPIIFFIICSIFYMSFYYHDKVVSQIWSYKICINEINNNNSEDRIRAQIIKEINKKMLLGRISKVSVDASSNKINTRFELNVNIPSIVGKSISKQITCIVKRKNECEYIRKIKVIKELESAVIK